MRLFGSRRRPEAAPRRFDPLHPPTSFDGQLALTDFRFRGLLAPAPQGVRTPVSAGARRQIACLRASRRGAAR